MSSNNPFTVRSWTGLIEINGTFSWMDGTPFDENLFDPREPYMHDNATHFVTGENRAFHNRAPGRSWPCVCQSIQFDI